MAKGTISISTFKCTVCGATTPLPRPLGRQREKRHIKDLYCFKCKTIMAHTEIRNFDFVLREQDI